MFGLSKENTALWTNFFDNSAKAVVADANKPFVLEVEGAIEALVQGLLLEESNPRRGQDGSAELQRVCAEALQERCACNLTACDVTGFVRAFPNFQSWRLTSTDFDWRPNSWPQFAQP